MTFRARVARSPTASDASRESTLSASAAPTRTSCSGGGRPPRSAPQPPSQVEPLPLALLPISARAEDALVATADRLAEHLNTHPDVTLRDLGYTLSQRRSHLNYRRTLVASSIADAQEQLQAIADGGQISAGRADPIAPKLAFVCTGMGPQWWKMCRGLLDAYPAFSREHPAQ